MGEKTATQLESLEELRQQAAVCVQCALYFDWKEESRLQRTKISPQCTWQAVVTTCLRVAPPGWQHCHMTLAVVACCWQAPDAASVHCGGHNSVCPCYMWHVLLCVATQSVGVCHCPYSVLASQVDSMWLCVTVHHM